MESHESPSEGCSREVLEEIGIAVDLGRLLCLDWVREEADPDGALILVHDGGVLTPNRIEQIVLPEDELSAFRFVDPAEVGQWGERSQRAASGVCSRRPRRVGPSSSSTGIATEPCRATTSLQVDGDGPGQRVLSVGAGRGR